MNYGHETADSVYAIISACSDTIVIIDSMVYFPPIKPDSIAGSEPDLLKLYLNYPGAFAQYNFRAYLGAIEVINMIVTLNAPVAPESIWTLGMNRKLNLEWTPVSGAIGYRIYRSLQSAGPYGFMKNPLEKICLFEDFDVVPNVDYYYYVVAVDSSMNHSGQSRSEE